MLVFEVICLVMNLSKLKPGAPSDREQVIRLALPVAWTGTILWLSLTSNPPEIPGPLGWDKLLHAGAYALLAILIAQYLCCVLRKPIKAVFYATWLSICFGMMTELLQMMVQTGRTAEWLDILADSIGAFLGSVLFCQIKRLSSARYERRNKNHG